MASACLETMTLWSQPLTARKSPAEEAPGRLSSSKRLRSFHQFSAAMTRRSRLCLPALYFCRTAVSSCGVYDIGFLLMWVFLSWLPLTGSLGTGTWIPTTSLRTGLGMTEVG